MNNCIPTPTSSLSKGVSISSVVTEDSVSTSTTTTTTLPSSSQEVVHHPPPRLQQHGQNNNQDIDQGHVVMQDESTNNHDTKSEITDPNVLEKVKVKVPPAHQVKDWNFQGIDRNRIDPLTATTKAATAATTAATVSDSCVYPADSTMTMSTIKPHQQHQQHHSGPYTSTNPYHPIPRTRSSEHNNQEHEHEHHFFYEHDCSKKNNMTPHSHQTSHTSSTYSRSSPITVPHPISSSMSFKREDSGGNRFTNHSKVQSQLQYYQFQNESNIKVNSENKDHVRTTSAENNTHAYGNSGPTTEDTNHNTATSRGLSSFYHHPKKRNASFLYSSNSNNNHHQQQQQEQQQHYDHKQFFSKRSNGNYPHEENHDYDYSHSSNNNSTSYYVDHPAPLTMDHHHDHHPSFKSCTSTSSTKTTLFSDANSPQPLLPLPSPPSPSSFPIAKDTNAALHALMMFEAEVEKQYQKCQMMQQEVEKEKLKYLKELEIVNKRRVEVAMEIAKDFNSGHHGHGNGFNATAMKENENEIRSSLIQEQQQQQQHENGQCKYIFGSVRSNEKVSDHNLNRLQNSYRNQELPYQQRLDKQERCEKQLEKHRSTKEATSNHHRQASSALDALALACAAEKSLISETNTKIAAPVTLNNVDQKEASPQSIFFEGDVKSMQQRSLSVARNNSEDSNSQCTVGSVSKHTKSKTTTTAATNLTKETFARQKKNSVFIKMCEHEVKISSSEGEINCSTVSNTANESKTPTAKTPMIPNSDDKTTAQRSIESSSRSLLSEVVAPFNSKDDDLAAHHFRNDGSWSVNVTTNDVLCGRGGLTNNHGGNVFFRGLVRNRQEAYLFASKRDKALVAHGIVDVIRSLDPPGRFLKKNKNQVWVEIGNKKAREKTSQALREKAPEIMELLHKEVDLNSRNLGQLLLHQHSNEGRETANCSPLVENKRRKLKGSVNKRKFHVCS